MKEGSSDILRS